jgi:lipid II:glycine glycyltransferase (peptidoglycan interpeptide bridge formation enzyme)
MQPEHTLIIDITKTEEEILGEMKPKGRYNIKVAEKSGVIVRRSDSVDNFYSLYATMANRQKITFRSKQYFQTLVDVMREKGYCEMFEAIINSEGRKIVLAAAIMSYYEDQAIYLFGGSSDKMRNVMAPYKLQWEAIIEAKRRGCKTYDFFGIAPDDNPKHAWAGVTRFKKQFGGEEVAILGSYDKIYKPHEYQLFKLAEKLRRH